MMEKKKKVSFPAKISKMGPNKIVWIPKALHLEIEKLENKEIVCSLWTTK